MGHSTILISLHNRLFYVPGYQKSSILELLAFSRLLLLVAYIILNTNMKVHIALKEGSTTFVRPTADEVSNLGHSGPKIAHFSETDHYPEGVPTFL